MTGASDVTRVLVEIPRVGLVMETARVQRWLKAVGDTVAPGETLLEVETEKSLVDIEASVAGRLLEILAQPEQEVAVGAPLAWIEDGRPQAAGGAAEQPVAAAAAAAVAETAPPAEVDASEAHRLRASPAARRLAAERNVDLSGLQGTGPRGRIQLEDVERAAGARPSASANAAAADSRQPLGAMRRAVARAMALSNATVPQFTVSRVVDWTEALAIRASLAARLEPEGASVSVNDLLLQAAARTLLEFPGLNGVFVGDPDAADAFIRPASGTAIGLVVALAEGMLVPVFHGAERRSLADIARQRSDAVVRARNFRLRHGEAGGATLTISNLGASGPDRFTAVLNPPESAILAMGRMRDLPVARDGAVVVRPVSDLTLTVDHRLADGRMASDFLARLVQILEGRDWTLE